MIDRFKSNDESLRTAPKEVEETRRSVILELSMTNWRQSFAPCVLVQTRIEMSRKASETCEAFAREYVIDCKSKRSPLSLR
jgi:hypothetical protein